MSGGVGTLGTRAVKDGSPGSQSTVFELGRREFGVSTTGCGESSCTPLFCVRFPSR